MAKSSSKSRLAKNEEPGSLAFGITLKSSITPSKLLMRNLGLKTLPASVYLNGIHNGSGGTVITAIKSSPHHAKNHHGFFYPYLARVSEINLDTATCKAYIVACIENIRLV